MAILVVGQDLVWWDKTLQYYAGVSSMLAQPTLDHIYQYILSGQHSKDGLLRWLAPDIFQTVSYVLSVIGCVQDTFSQVCSYNSLTGHHKRLLRRYSMPIKVFSGMA